MNNLLNHKSLLLCMTRYNVKTAIAFFVYISLAMLITIFTVERTMILRKYNVDYNVLNSTTNILRYFIFFLGMVSCISYKFKLKTVLCLVYFIFSYVVSRTSGSWFLFDLFFIPIFLSKDIDVHKVMNIFLYIFIICISVTAVLDLCNFLPQLSFGKRGRFTRYSLGFIHPNSLGLMLMLLGMVFVLKVKQLRYRYLLFPFTLGIMCIVIPNSYTTSFILFCLTFLLLPLVRFQKYQLSAPAKTRLFISALLVFTGIIAAAYFIALTGHLKEFIEKLQGSLWARFHFGAVAYNNLGFSLFGQPYYPKDTWPDYFIVDSLYFYLPIFIGVIPSIVYLLCQYASVWYSVKNNNHVLLVIMTLIFVYSISECIVISPIFMFIYFNSKAQVNLSEITVRVAE